MINDEKLLDARIEELKSRLVDRETRDMFESFISELESRKNFDAWDIAIDANPPIFRVYNAPEGRRYQIDGVDTAQNGFWLDRWRSEIDKHNKAFPLNKVTLPPDQEMFQKIVTNQLKPYGSFRSFTTNALTRNKKIY